jgi:solute carrier family 25 (mitochondrial citrate transporter), member 1
MRCNISITLTHAQAKKRGFITTGVEIVKRETPLGLYKGLGAVLTGIVPKMAIRFTSFEAYKKLLANKETGIVSGQSTFVGKYFCDCCHS